MSFARLCTIATEVIGLLVASAYLQNTRLEAQSPSQSDLLLIGQTAPAWSLRDLDGRDVHSSQFAGKVVVVDFWATWCSPCIKEIPGYVALQNKYGADLAVIGVSVDRMEASGVKAFAEKLGINYTVVVADESVIQSFGGIQGIPTTFIIDRDGKFAHKKVGAMAHADYERLVKRFLK